MQPTHEKAVERGTQTAIESAFQNSVEFNQAIAVLTDYLQQHNLMFAKHPNWWVAMYADGRLFAEGERDTWYSFSEMLKDLLAKVDEKEAA